MKCLLQAFSIITSYPLNALTERLGAKAEQVIDPYGIGAARFRGLHPQEIIDVALDIGYAVTIIEVCPGLAVPSISGADPGVKMVYDNFQARFQHYLDNYDGIFCGSVNSSNLGHAVAWKSLESGRPREIVDPTGLWKPGDRFNAEILMIFSKMTFDSLRTDQRDDIIKAKQEQEGQNK